MRKYWLIGGGVVGALLLLLVAAVLIVPNLIPQEVYRAKIEEVGSQALGRKVTVTGNIRIGVFPRIEAKAGASTIANPDGFDQPNFASMKELRAAVSLWPLLFGNVEVEEFVLVEPTITLVSLEDGKNNWTFTPAPGPAADPAKPAQSGSMGASLRDVRIEKGHVSFDDRKEKKIQTLSDLNFSADMQALDKPLSFKADGLANDLKFNIESKIENPKATMDGVASPVEIKLQTDLIRTELKGKLGLGDKPSFDFAMTGEIPEIAKLGEAFKTPLPATAVLGKLTLSGQAYGSFDDITIKVASARHESALLNADLKGETRIAKGITLQLEANAEAPNLAALAQAMDVTAPAEAALGKATVAAKISGSPEDLQFTNVNFSHTSGLLNLLFTGSAHLKDRLTYSGNVTIAAPDLRKLASAAGATLPPGDIYKTFSLTGQTSGSATDVMLKNAEVKFDSITGTGEAALSLGAKPRLTGTLSTSAIDITPYASASGAPAGDPTPATPGWGSTPIDLSPLKLADAVLTLKAAGVRYDKFKFGPSNISVTLTNGRLVADLKQTSLFSGTGSARFVADGSSAKPAIELKAKMDKLAVKDLLAASSGFTMLEGIGGLDIDIAGSGGTLQTLMSSLVGQGQFAFDDSVLKGVNLTELGAAASTALTTRKFSTSAFSPTAQTNFNALNAGFAMKDGVAVLTGMKIDAGTMTIDAGGALDIGRQELSLNLFPIFADKKAGLNGYGLPMKLSGGWGGVKFAPDWGFLADKATAGAKAKVQSEIQDELKGISDGLLGKLGLGPLASTQPSKLLLHSIGDGQQVPHVVEGVAHRDAL
ncbi:MAG: AsmA family protein, partial [Hyphomonadaceae bacterium]